jgi:predicted lysophospholipase L1 biosynthesis ABC-type transport system permease subunit
LGFHAEAAAARAEALPALLRLVTQANQVLGGLLLLFCFGIGVSLGGTWSSLRRWDVGVLSSLGWSRRRILRCYLAEIGIVGAVTAAASIVLGSLGSLGLGMALEGRTLLGATFAGGLAVPPPSWLAAVCVGMPLALVLGSAPRVLRLASLPPDVALRRDS